MMSKGEQWTSSEDIMFFDMGFKNNIGTKGYTCDKMKRKDEQWTNYEDIMPIGMGFKNNNGTNSPFTMNPFIVEKPGTKGEDIMPFNRAATGCNKTKNLCCAELMIKNEPDTNRVDIMPFNNGLNRNNETINSCESINDGAVIKQPGDMANLKDVFESDSKEISKEIGVDPTTCVDNIDNITENLSKNVLESDSKEFDVCTATCVDKIDNTTENSNVLESNRKDSSKEIEICTSTCVDTADIFAENSKNGTTNATVKSDEAFNSLSSNAISDTTKPVTVRKRHKAFNRRKNKTVQQHEDSICDKNKSLVKILKRNITKVCEISLVLLYVFCKLFTHKYTGFMMVLRVSSCENIPETSLILRIDAEEKRHGNTAILKCTTNDMRRLCDIKGKSRRWTKGSNHIPLITNGESMNNSKFVEHVNKNCTEVELRIKLFNEQDINVEYNFVYGFEQTTINLTLGNCKYRRYPINQTALLDIQYIHDNLTVRLFLKDIYPIPNCTANLQGKIFPLKKADVNETILSYDVTYIFSTLLEFDECKGEVHIQCSYGKSLEFEKRKTFRCSSGSMTKKSSSYLPTKEIVAVVFAVISACAIIVAAILCWYLKCKRGGVQGHKKTRRHCCMFRPRDENIQTHSDNTRALISHKNANKAT